MIEKDKNKNKKTMPIKPLVDHGRSYSTVMALGVNTMSCTGSIAALCRQSYDRAQSTVGHGQGRKPEE